MSKYRNLTNIEEESLKASTSENFSLYREDYDYITTVDSNGEVIFSGLAENNCLSGHIHNEWANNNDPFEEDSSVIVSLKEYTRVNILVYMEAILIPEIYENTISDAEYSRVWGLLNKIMEKELRHEARLNAPKKIIPFKHQVNSLVESHQIEGTFFPTRYEYYADLDSLIWRVPISLNIYSCSGAGGHIYIEIQCEYNKYTILFNDTIDEYGDFPIKRKDIVEYGVKAVSIINQYYEEYKQAWNLKNPNGEEVRGNCIYDINTSFVKDFDIESIKDKFISTGSKVDGTVEQL